MMTAKRGRKQIYKKCILVLIWLLLFGNLADECVSIELRPADFCDDCLCVPVQPSPKSCGQCIDIPIYTGLEKINRVAKQLNSTFPASAVIVPANKFNLSAYSSASNTFDATSYFTPLCTVILLI
jgi:hypothetical protein